MTAEVLEAVFQNDYSNSDSSSNEIHENDIIIKNQVQGIDMFITVSVSTLTVRGFMRSM